MLTVISLGLPAELLRSLACTNIIENMMGTVRRVCRKVKRWQDASMTLRWPSAAMLEAAKGFGRLKAYKAFSALRAALAAHQATHAAESAIELAARGRVTYSIGNARRANFNRHRDIPLFRGELVRATRCHRRRASKPPPMSGTGYTLAPGPAWCIWMPMIWPSDGEDRQLA
jgi:hypothetical protein